MNLSGGIRHGNVDFALGHADHAHRESDVLVHIHVRIERVALEHHGDVAVARFGVGDISAIQENAAFAGFLQAGDDAQRRGLAGAGGTEQGKEFTRFDVEIDAVQRREGAVPLDDLPERYLPVAHLRPPPLTAPTVKPFTIWRCANRPSRITGAIVTMAAAASFAHNVCSTEMKLNIATVT